MAKLRSIVEEEKGKLASTMIGGYRRKAIVTLVKTWMVVSAETGEARVEDVDKHSIMRRTGLPARDLRGIPDDSSNNVDAAPKQLPFEFKALEACIESACTCLESEASVMNGKCDYSTSRVEKPPKKKR
ncbi:magnesium transporter MRS2-f-like [Trifolium medium]|uniref:Magnesium transporter MRS2-f-like n=1 Tax=Trifolium medium TaxID=97028 RepID=A0A392NEG1_9FABA|nr:magnesium transporter MRS2-f-like [Trifolium medium]